MDLYYLSKMTRKDFSNATNEIYLATDYNHNQYQKYFYWFYKKNIPRILDGSGEVIFIMDGNNIVGLAILKKSPDENKICTFMVCEEYRKKGYSKLLLEKSFEYLGTTMPLITIPFFRLDEFMSIIKSYNWSDDEISDKYLSKEVIFNIPKKIVLLDNENNVPKKIITLDSDLIERPKKLILKN